MNRKIVALAIAMVFVLGSAVSMAADPGKLKVKLVNFKGVTTNGSVVAKKGAVVKKCTTNDGGCTLVGLDAGTWAISAKAPSGAKGSGSKAVAAGKTASLVVQVK